MTPHDRPEGRPTGVGTHRQDTPGAPLFRVTWWHPEWSTRTNPKSRTFHRQAPAVKLVDELDAAGYIVRCAVSHRTHWQTVPGFEEVIR